MLQIDSESEDEEVTLEFRVGSPKLHKSLERPLTILNHDGEIELGIDVFKLAGGMWNRLEVSKIS